MSTVLASSAIGELTSAMAAQLNGIQLEHVVLERSDGPYLVFLVGRLHERFFRVLERALKSTPDENPFKERTSIRARSKFPESRLTLPETDLLRVTISESLTVDRYSFAEDFFSRYTASVTNLERQVTANANFIVYGRRGAGKSSLLAYAMHMLMKERKAFAWISLQTYANQGGALVSVHVFREVLTQLGEFGDPSSFSNLLATLHSLEASSAVELDRQLSQVLPRIREALGKLSRASPVTIFLDDLHLLREEFQPVLLSHLYSVTRGNRCFIKASGIEQFTRPWNSTQRQGLEPTHDAQILKLDYNLTVPDKSLMHICSILDAHAHYCGLPDIKFLTRPGVLARLVLVAAAVPRDAMSLFSSAISKATAKNEKRVSVTSVNAAASEMAEEKVKAIDTDISGDAAPIKALLEQIKEFCINKNRQNAFLIEIRNADPIYQTAQRLIALRLVHVLHEGITPHKAGRRYLALMLDYGFYVGIRAATSVELFPKKPQALTAKELRKLPIFKTA